MSWTQALAREILEQPELQSGEILEKELDGGAAITISVSELELHKLITYSRSGLTDTAALGKLEELLKLSFTERFISNTCPSISGTDELSVTAPFFNGFQAPIVVENTLANVRSALDSIVDQKGPGQNECVDFAQGDWMQV